MLRAKKRVEGLIESSDTYLSQGNVQKARASLEDAKSTCEKHNLGSGVMSKINRRPGDINRAQGVANYKERRKSFSGASRRNSSVASARRESSIGVSVEKGNPLIDTVPRDMSKPSTSRSSAHDGSVNDEVFVNSASFLKQLDESNRASDACQESRRRSSLGSASDTLVVCNAFDAILKNKGYSIDRDVLSNRITGLMQEVRKSRSQSESRLPGKTDNKPEARFSYSINDSANEKVTKTSLKHGSCLDNTSTGTGLSTPVSKPRHRRGSTFVISSPNPNSQFTNGSQSDCNSPSTDMDGVQQPKCDISLSREGGK